MNDGLKGVKPTETGPYPDVAPFTEWIGITLAISGQGVVCLQLRQRCALNNRRGVAHGGVARCATRAVHWRPLPSLRCGCAAQLEIFRGLPLMLSPSTAIATGVQSPLSPATSPA